MTQLDKTGLLGEVREVGGVPTVHVEDVYDTDIDDLWAAVTEPARLARWLGQVSGDLRQGGRIAATFTSGWEGPGRVDVCDAPQHLLLTLEPGTADETRIEARLSAEAAGTRLVVEERGLPAEDAPGYAAGWHTHLEHLRARLEGREPGSWIDRVLELKPAYQRP